MFDSQLSRVQVCVGASVVAVGSAIVYQYLIDETYKRRKTCTIFGMKLGLEETLQQVQEVLVEEERKLHRLEKDVGRGGAPRPAHRQQSSSRKRISVMERVSLMFDPSATTLNARRVSDLIQSFDILGAQVDSITLSVWEREKGANGRKLQLLSKQLTKRVERNLNRCDLLAVHLNECRASRDGRASRRQ